MNTDQEEVYEDFLVQIGHLSSELSLLLAVMTDRKIDRSTIEYVKRKVYHHDRAIIEKLGVAEQSIQAVRAMIDQWMRDAKARLR